MGDFKNAMKDLGDLKKSNYTVREPNFFFISTYIEALYINNQSVNANQ